MHARLYVLAELFPVVMVAVSVLLTSVGLAIEPCPSGSAGGC